MSRHRNVRSLRYSDECEGYDDVYGHSLEEDPSSSCLSPGEQARWMFDRGRETLASYYEEPEDENGEEPRAEAAEEGSPAKAPIALDDAEHAKLVACLDEVRDVLGDTVPEDVVLETIVAERFDAQRVLDKLLSNDETKAKSKDGISLASLKQPLKTIETFKLESSAARTRTPTPERIVVALPPPKSPEPVRFPPDDKPPVRPKDRADPRALYRAERDGDKPRLHLVVIGHVDAGKSTLVGRMLCDLGEVSQRTLHKYEQESRKLGKQSFAYAWVLDETGEERARGITMDVGRVRFATRTKSVTVLDAPGHADFIPNMIAGAAHADAALLVVDATTGEFESGFDLGGQTREHAVLARSLGIARVAVAVNKLDAAGWARARFDEIRAKLGAFLRQVGFREADLTFVPLSGLTGENLVRPATEGKLKEWYDGPCLLDAIDAIEPPERPVSRPFRMSVDDVFKGTGAAFCASGRVETGCVACGDRVLVCPTREAGTVKAVHVNDAPCGVAFAGDHASVTLAGVDMQSVSAGCVLCDPANPAPVATVFEARIVVFNVKTPITKGYPVLLHHGSAVDAAHIVKLKASINKSTGEVVKRKPRCLGNNSAALVDIEVAKPICVEAYKDFKELGRIMLRVGGATVAAGLVTAIVK